MQPLKRKDPVPARSSFSAPAFGSPLPEKPAWVSNTQVPDNPPSAHYSVTPSPAASLIFNPWKRLQYGDAYTPSSGSDHRAEHLDATAGSAGSQRASPDATVVRHARVFVLALAITAGALGFLVTAGKLAVKDRNVEDNVATILEHATDESTFLRRGSRKNVRNGDIGGRARIGDAQETIEYLGKSTTEDIGEEKDGVTFDERKSDSSSRQHSQSTLVSVNSGTDDATASSLATFSSVQRANITRSSL
ncbi:hypothetical protein MTO96_043723 [Rhipicephalus appendiculatus]